MRLSDAHAQSTAECLAALESSPDGLATPEAARRLADCGPNSLPETRARGPLLRLLLQFHNVLIYVLIGAAVVTGALQH